MKRILMALLSGGAMTSMIATANAAVEFGLFDTDRDGFITATEFTAGLGNAGLFEGGGGFFGTFDDNDDGFLGLDEIEDDDEQYFAGYDANGDARLNRDESYGGLFGRFDANDDERISEEEFNLFGTEFELL